MKNLSTKYKSNFNIYIVLAVCSILVGISTEAFGNTMDSSDKIPKGSSPNQQLLNPDLTLVSQRQERQGELSAFSRSKYNYCDAKLLSEFWGESVIESKAIIGRKVLWGDGGIPYLEQFLVDARIQAIQKDNRPCTFYELGYTYEDAVMLADFWGDSSPWEAKQRIERNLLLGKQRTVNIALKKARRR